VAELSLTTAIAVRAIVNSQNRLRHRSKSVTGIWINTKEPSSYIMGKFRKKSSKQGAFSNVSEKETGNGPANEQLESLSMSSMSSKQPGIWCGLPLPWKRRTGRKKVRNFLNNVQ
jgi:hypothetical protein